MAWVNADATVLGDPTLNYAVCFIAMIIEGTSLGIAIHTINKKRNDK